MNVNKKILVVDDSETMRRIIRQELEQGGYSVVEAKDGYEALIKSSENPPPDLITLDLEMPKLDGFATCQKIRAKQYSRFFKNSKDSMVPIVFITSKDNIEDRKKSFNLGASEFILKPFEKGQLLATVNKILMPAVLSNELVALIVDDSEVARHIVSDILTQIGLTTIEAEDGEEAFKIMENKTAEIDLVITDFVMPGMSGVDLTQKIRKELNLQELPIIFLTAMADQSSLLDVFKAGASDYIVKPFAKEELIARITVHIERNRLTHRLRDMIDKQMELIQFKDQFLSVCSHDLRNPLNAILGFTQLMLDNQDIDEDFLENLQHIKTSGKMMLTLINDILDVAQFQSAQANLDLKPILLSDVIKESMNLMAGMAVKKKQELSYINHSSLGYTMGNYNALLRVFNNLLTNAIKFTHSQGKIKVTTEDDSQGYIIASVQDTGIGIQKEKIAALFDHFTMHTQHGTNGEIGTGLGMSIVKAIVEKHNGWIEVESEVGQGSCFKIFLPIIDSKDIVIVENAHVQLNQDNKDKFKKPKTLNVLIAEDNPINLKIAVNMLEQCGFSVQAATDGICAVEKFFQSPNQFDIIFMDIKMPELDGREATKLIRSKGYDKIPIIATSGIDTDEEKRACLSVGMNDFITKPFQKEDFLDCVNKLIDTDNIYSRCV
jgi:CheY-like chemotaxis protein/two-component sensor histidine kinase